MKNLTEPQALGSEEDKTLDQEFIDSMLEIEKKYVNFKKHDKIRIEQWTKKLCQVTTNIVWKKNRNLYAKLLLSNVLNRVLQEPYLHGPPEGALPKLNKFDITNRIGKPPVKPLDQPNMDSYSSEKKKKSSNNSPLFSENSNKKDETSNKKLFASSINFNSPIQKTDDFQGNLKNEFEILRLNEKELKNELNLKNNQNSMLSNELNTKNEEIKQLKNGYTKMNTILEKVQGFFKQNDKKLDKLENFQEIKKLLLELNKKDKNFDFIKKEDLGVIDDKRNDFDSYLTMAHSETSKFLEKLESFQKKTELLKHEVEENCKNSRE